MSTDSPSRPRLPGDRVSTGGSDRRLDLPPGYTALTLREKDDAFAHACDIAVEEGAGTLVWTPRFDSIEMALVLEPGEPLASARRVLYPLMAAVADAIAAHCPPERPLIFNWPDTFVLDGGIVGGLRLAWPEGAAEDAVPDWLVAGVILRTIVVRRRPLPQMLADGAIPLAPQFDDPLRQGNTLQGDDLEMMPAERLIGSFCRHFLRYLDQWHETSFTPVAQAYLARLPEVRGLQRGIDVDGALLERRTGDTTPATRHDLPSALALMRWRDPETGEPWL